ncbi:MAG TPA: DUF4388 domain-containing protein [Blastocatellia bacterium]|nr:DUF4388 domain-containing protein [Blastocatellia bacterium]
MNLGKERREAKRISYICEVECEGAGISRMATRITDLSTTGAFIDSMINYAPGTQLTLKFRVKDQLIETEGEVRYSLRQMGMGVQFTNMRPEHLALLEHLIEGKPLVVPAAPVPAAPVAAAPVAETPAAPAAGAQYMLTGNFAIVSLFDVIQIIENNHLTGALVISSAVAAGEIHFNDGRIVGALLPGAVGQEALIKFLDVTEGSFTFHKSETEYPRTIQASSNMGLMLDLLRVKDEEAAFSSLSDS